MENDNQDSQQKVKALFDARAKLLPDCNSVLDANDNVDVKFQNVYRDYLSRNLARSVIRPGKNEVILDFGCGVGRLSEFLAKDAGKIIGLDLSDEMLKVAEKNKKSPNIEYKNTSEIAELQDNTFDKIFTFWVLQHIEDVTLSKYIEKFHRLLKDNGTLFVFEQTQTATTNYNDVHIQRAGSDYENLFLQGSFQLIKKKNVFRFPSYGMDIWTRMGVNSRITLKMARMVEGFTVNRKPEHAQYYTQLFVFKKQG
ncbi:MAG: methyltransferase domain-containing protein [Acidobacteria bacterium]|nr:methyltransferase domain-containing protein [Acidobacteriota bacterium]